METTNSTSNTARPLAMVRIVDQKWQELYTPDVAYDRGTLFQELDKPFLKARI